MKKLMIRVVVPLALAAGAALALASPASASPPRQTGYLDATTLSSICSMAGGYFAADPNGGSHFCVLPDGQVILCDTGSRTCVVIEATAPDSDKYWTPPYIGELQVQGDPVPVLEIAPVTVGVRSVRLAHLKW
jgi:hypothetical protein